jgi:hypothetical protein
MKKNKAEIITFKADAALSQAMEGIENRSDFIRKALLAALEGTCPLCKGTGVLTPRQIGHWQEFERSHTLTECGECHELHLRCNAEE